MKIYAVVTTIKDLACFWEVIRYFSEDKEKCEKYAEENSGEWHKMEVKEFDSETKLNVAHAEIW